jgi:hypothetical protein
VEHLVSDDDDAEISADIARRRGGGDSKDDDHEEGEEDQPQASRCGRPRASSSSTASSSWFFDLLLLHLHRLRMLLRRWVMNDIPPPRTAYDSLEDFPSNRSAQRPDLGLRRVLVLQQSSRADDPELPPRGVTIRPYTRALFLLLQEE